jgi:hypothetical protein
LNKQYSKKCCQPELNYRLYLEFHHSCLT